jgi:hypothetical protein
MLYLFIMAACMCIIFGRKEGQILFSIAMIGALIWKGIDILLK